MIRIRKTRKGDLKMLAKMNAEAFKDTSERQALWVFRHSLEKGIREACLVAEEEGGIVGAVFAEKKLTFYPKAAEIKSIFVKKGWQRKGIGKALMDKSLGVLKKKRIRNVSLSVEMKNKAAVSLYRKYGFRPFRILYLKRF